MAVAAREAPRELEPFVALLRGVNVGGKNRVPMAELRAGLTARGLRDVRTYIASGNVLLSAPGGPDAPQRLTEEVTSVIATEFDVTCAVLVKTGAQIRSIAEALPEKWVHDEDLRVEVLYLFEDVDEPATLDRLPARDGVDRLLYTPGAVLWAIPRGQGNLSGLRRIIGGPIYSRTTGRNGRTARKLAELVAAAEATSHARR
jgi:uncharacterized protein (DUF1697 family)